jgi:glycosyltransferase involved in cell wall biosynthesis
LDTLRKYFYKGDEKILQVPGFYHSFHTPNLLQKNFKEAKNHFLWFGSSRFIHRGVDLLLDIFLRRTDLYLHICGPIQNEPMFWNNYQARLAKSKNIFIHGFVDITSVVFKRILDRCAFLIYPSASEANSASVLTVLGNGGLIPIVTKNCSLDFPSFSIEIEGGVDNAVEERNIEKAIEKALTYSIEDIKSNSEAAFDFVKEHHSTERYEERMRENLNTILRSRQDQDHVLENLG